MSRSRRMPPLFEVMRQTNPLSRTSGALRAAEPPAPPVIERPPVEAPARPSRLNGSQVLRPVAPDIEGETDGPSQGRGGRFSVEATGARIRPLLDLNREYVLPARWALAGLGVLVGVLILVWAVAHRTGAAQERARLMPQAPTSELGSGSPAPAVAGGLSRTGFDNSTAPPPAVLPNQPRPNPPAPDSTSKPSGKPTSGTQSPAKIIQSAADDPRQAGYNYLYVVTTSRQDEAEATAAFLTQNGIPAAAINTTRVDTDPAKANNRPKWRVFVSEGIASVGYSRSQRRLDLETAVKKLGEQWKKNPRGGFNFDSCGWEPVKAPTGTKPGP